MSDTPDPTTVREIVRKHIESGRDDIGTTVVKHFGSGALDDEAFAAWEYAVHQARWHSGAQITVSWPDEQPQDERDVCTCGEPRKVCELRTELDQYRAALGNTYRERAHLVALLAAVYPSHIGRTDPNVPDWPVVTLQLPTGQAAWHTSAADEDLFEHVEDDPERAFEYDGHSTEEKYQRIRTLTAELATAEMGPHDVMAMPTGEQPQDDGDVRAVAALLEVIGNDDMAEYDARKALQVRFADRIAVLEARDAKGGEEQ